MNDLIFHIFASLAQWERSMILERQAEGIAAAKAKGLPMGRPSKATKEQKEAARALFRENSLYSISEVARRTGITRFQVRKCKNEVENENKNS